METLVWNNDMLVSAIILTLTFVAIFTEEIHKIHRVKSAMAGAAIMIVGGQIMGFYDPEEAVHAIDWNVVFLLGGIDDNSFDYDSDGRFSATCLLVCGF